MKRGLVSRRVPERESKLFFNKWVLILLIAAAFVIFILLFKSPPPQILSASVYPQKVMPGQILVIKAEVKDNLIIKNIKASIETDDLPDVTRLLLVDGSIRQGIYERGWIVHDTSAQKWYNITITATNLLGKTASIIIPYQDPTQSHNASEITGGTFTGNYTFAGGDININRNANLGGNLNVTQSLNLMDDYTKLLLHFSTSTNGTNASSAIDSATGKTVAGSYGQAHLDTQYSKFGSSALRLDGTGDYLTLADSADWDFGTGDFTIDYWLRFNSIAVSQSFFDIGDLSNSKGTMLYWLQTDGTLRPNFNGIEIMSRSWSPLVNTWYHIALTRSGTSLRLFIDGVQQGATVTDSTNIDASTYGAAIGARNYGPGTQPFNGSLDEVRVSKGIARWTSAFSVPTSEYGTAKFGDVQYYGEDKTTRYKVGSFTRDTSTASGTQAVTGVGFKPKAVIFFGTQVNTVETTWGFDDGTTPAYMNRYGATNFNIDAGTNSISSIETAGGNEYAGKISSLDSDGFTITWAKTGSPTGTLYVIYLAFR